MINKIIKKRITPVNTKRKMINDFVDFTKSTFSNISFKVGILLVNRLNYKKVVVI